MHVVLVGADSVDPVSGDAVISSGCAEARELAMAAMRGSSDSASGRGAAKVVVVCAAWNEAPANTIVLEPEAQGLLVGLPPRPATC